MADRRIVVQKAPRPTSVAKGNATIANRQHARYTEWVETWRHLGYVYEGDGPYMNGSALIPHTRELLYAEDATGVVDYSNVIGEKRKIAQRRQLARYENFAATIIDTLVDHQYAKKPVRIAADQQHPYLQWTSDVDGQGTDLTTWLSNNQPLPLAFGHVFVVVDRLPVSTRTILSLTGPNAKRTRQDVGRPVLKIYTPVDVPDWLTDDNNRLTAIKAQQPVLRKSLTDDSDTDGTEFLVWDDTMWTRYDKNGTRKDSKPHGFGVLPVIPFYARRRARIPVVGRSILGDPNVFRDHYNLISEMREIFRSQTFSVMAIGLGDGETIAQGRSRLGDHLGTDSLVFTRGTAAFIAPAEGPVKSIAEELSAIERKMFRRVGLPWEGDSAAPESADSRRIKAMDLNRLLARSATEAERFEKRLARVWFAGEYGAANIESAMETAKLQIDHPDEFYVAEVQQAVKDIQATTELGVGETAEILLTQSVVPLLLKSLTPEQREKIDREIEAVAKQRASEHRALADARLLAASAPPQNDARPANAPIG